MIDGLKRGEHIYLNFQIDKDGIKFCWITIPRLSKYLCPLLMWIKYDDFHVSILFQRFDRFFQVFISSSRTLKASLVLTLAYNVLPKNNVRNWTTFLCCFPLLRVVQNDEANMIFLIIHLVKNIETTEEWDVYAEGSKYLITFMICKVEEYTERR